MSNVERTEIVGGESSAGRRLAHGVLAVAALGYVGAWATLLQWVDETAALAGAGLFDLFGGALLAVAVGLTAAGIGSRFGYVESTPSSSAGAAVGLAFGLLWGVAGGLAAAHWVGGGAAAWAAALACGGLGTAAGTVPREDVGSTLPAAALLALTGAAIAGGYLDADWTWESAWSSAVFPGSELVPVIAVVGSLLGLWSGAKAKEGFGTEGRQSGAFVLIGTGVFSVLAVLGLLVGFIVVRGFDAMLTGASLAGGRLALPFGASLPWPELPFVTNPTGGLYVAVPGVLPAILGTLWLVVGAVAFALPLGIGAAVFLTEYAEQGRFVQVVEVATNGLWSTPSIVFGLFGLAFLVPRISGGNSILVGQLVLGFMLLPLVLITSREAIKAVPDEYRDASAALGVSRWETIRSVVLPAAMPGVITGAILGVGRIAGETAPLLLVFGGQPYPSSTPNVLGSFRVTAQPPFVTNEALLSPASALPYQLYSAITAGTFPKETFTTTEFGWGTALVLLLVVIGLYAVGVGSRLYFRRKLRNE
ncbi:phosphate ABC transporter permease PstA [Halostella sp. JP-L12]|uniref:phosphate ABC transporter permease PstA n=1 Tax=Halostella TaxID=1843185 RepID=UPI000EF7AEA2|nr:MULTISPECIES: phosphate ABC transporter permease PstA [Halostella]NHN48152.1 phosphate ABC transporter permease PstA [Halostella sp. JP-L12]